MDKVEEKVEEKVEKKEKNRLTYPEILRCTSAINDLMVTRGLTERQVITLFKLISGFAHDMTTKEMASLLSKNMISVDDKGKISVKEEFLWGDGEVLQMVMEMPHDSAPIVDKIASLLVDNIAKELLPNEKQVNSDINKLARDKFGNDLTMARYYYILQKIFPPLIDNEGAHPKWREHFQVTPPSYTRWYSTGAQVTRFKRIYVSKTEDIAIFLVGTYFYIKKSTDPAKDICYATRSDEYMRNYKEWYETAVEHVKKSTEKKKARASKKTTRKNKTDTL